MKSITIFSSQRDDVPRPIPVQPPVWLDADGAQAAMGSQGRLLRDDGVLLVSAMNAAHFVAAALVSLANRVAASLNGVPLRAGLHRLKHADQLVVGERTAYWVAERLVAREALYSPAVHGADVFCSRTKKRVVAEQRIVFCAGCDWIYLFENWADGGPCNNCRFDLNQPEWTPPAPSRRSRLNELLDLSTLRR